MITALSSPDVSLFINSQFFRPRATERTLPQTTFGSAVSLLDEQVFMKFGQNGDGT